MTTLVVELDGRTLRFDQPRLIRIGRSIDADVLLTAPSVSRVHAELRPVDGGFMLVDSGSQFGTYINGDRVREHRVTGRVTVQCGPPASGSSFVLEPAGAAPPAAQPPASPPAQPPSARPLPPVPPSPGPGHTVVASVPRGTVVVPTQRSGPDLLVVAQGREHRLRHPAQLRVGRSPECEVVVDDESCSRHHGLITAVPGAWVYTDQSQEGSFDQGRRVATKQFDDRLDLRLGHPVAGATLTLVPVLSAVEDERRIARRRRRRTLLVTLVVLAVLALVASTTTLAVVLAMRDDDGAAAEPRTSPGTSEAAPAPTSEPPAATDTPDQLTGDELDHAKAATVLLLATAPDGNGGSVSYTGSGSIIRSDGLILTNAHVAKPSADGLDAIYGSDDTGDPQYLLVALVEGDDDAPAAPEYRARLVVADGYSDAAVVQIYATAEGGSVDPATLDLPTMELGDSDELRSGDDVTVLGYPGISSSMRLTVTKGVISTFIDVAGLGERSEIDTDARIAPGNSGGSAIDNEGRLIGIPSALFSERGTQVVSGRIRPINVVLPLIEEAER